MKIKTIIIILCLNIPILLTGQGISSIDFVSGIDYSFRTLNTSLQDDITQLILDSRDGDSKKLNWRFGLNYNIKVDKKLYLKTGIRLARIGYKGEKRTGLIWTQSINGSPPNPNLPSEVQFIYDYYFIEVPIIGRLDFLENKLTPFLELGISPSLYLRSRTKTITDLSTDVEFHSEENSAFNKLHFVGNLSLGVNYRINGKYHLFGQTIFRYHLTKTADSDIKEHLYNYGIEVGMRRILK